MDKFDNKKFIEEIKIRPAIWDKTRKEEYNDQYTKKLLWEEICSALYPEYDKLSSKDKDTLELDLRARWKNLRDAYVRYLRITKTKKRHTQKRIKPYVYAPYLEFYKSIIHASRLDLFKHKRKLKVETMNNSSNDCFMEEVLEFSNDKDNEDDSAFLVQNQNEKEMNNIEKGRPYIINMFPKTSTESGNNMSSCEQDESVAGNRVSDIDDDMDFFRSLIPFIKSLPLCKKISFRTDIMKIAKEYADNLEKSGVSLISASSLSSNSLMNSTFHQQMYLPVVSIQTLPFHDMNSNKKSVESCKKKQSNSSSDDNLNTSSPL